MANSIESFAEVQYYTMAISYSSDPRDLDKFCISDVNYSWFDRFFVLSFFSNTVLFQIIIIIIITSIYVPSR